MKQLLLALGAVALLSTGCMNRYDVTLRNGYVVTARTKPKLDTKEGIYVFKNGKGEMVSVPASRVAQIAPHERTSSKDEFFKGSAGSK